ncbi:MAG: hypothetical protein MUE83_12140 [Tabrizicola sp.]|jgi:hypothetical protein|nr:hypothetical protein [Tabrizicola sp.]
MPAKDRPIRLAVLIAAAVAGTFLTGPHPALSDPANLVAETSGATGATARLVIAQRTYLAAMKHGDAVMLLSAIRLARSVTLREPMGWDRTTSGEAAPDQPTGRVAPADPAGPETLAIVQALAGEDPSLQDLVYDLDAQRPHRPRATVSRASAELAGGQSDAWRIALSGLVPAEIGVIGDGDSPLGLTVTDETGAIICARAPDPDPALCRFTPARNGFFQVTVANAGKALNSYHLLGN